MQDIGCYVEHVNQGYSSAAIAWLHGVTEGWCRVNRFKKGEYANATTCLSISHSAG
jgi:hypothetical protein